MLRLFLVIVLLSLAFLLPAQSVVISDVRIVDVRNGTVSGPINILVSEGRIVEISRDNNLLNRPGVTVIDGEGNYASPGLSEMHAHIPSPNQGSEYTMDVLFLYLSNGITNIRGMLGHPNHLELRTKAISNEILSPRIYTSSPSLNGNSVPSVEVAQKKVQQYAEEGYDFLKIHPGIKLEVFREIVRASEEYGIEFSGHVPVDVGIWRALEFGYGTVDHVDGFLEGLVPESARVNPNDNGFFGYNFTDLANEETIPELVALVRQTRVWVVPTQSLFDRWFSPMDVDELAKAPEMKYMPRETIQAWVKSKKDLVGSEEYSAEKWGRFINIRRKLIKSLHDQGYGLLLGSDAPQVFNVPGFSIHHEMDGMKKAGLSNLEILRTGTVNPAIYMGMEGQFGEIIRGASADIVLSKDNPLENLGALQDLEGVMVRGRWLSKKEINDRLKEIATKNK
jgi:hypothetical protein